jgi:Flp pilus assembly protein TadD
MTKSLRLTSAASLIAVAAVIAGCAAPQNRVAASGGKANGKVGLATRALAALTANDVTGAVSLAEQAVERTPDDAGLRLLLGNTYFAAGRFASAEATYKDTLALSPGQPQVVLKLALVTIAQGKNAEALSLLDSNRDLLHPADYGLALALAGRAADAVPVLESAARVPNADGRIRQNLALAYAFSGDWDRARLIAGQDVPADQIDGRMMQWVQLARPAKASDQVAALTGIDPAASDPGQPVRLALRQPGTQMAEAAPAAAAAPPQPAFAESAPAPQQPQFAEAAPVPQPQFTEAAPPPPPPPAVEAAPPPPPPSVIARLAESAQNAVEGFVDVAPRPKAKVSRASVTMKLPKARTAVLRSGKSNAVVQLGAYRSPKHMSAAWATLTQRHPALRSYLPVKARFDSPKGTFYRLSIQGFASQQEAIARCSALKSRGGKCFVRTVAGDAPIQIASR